MFKRLKTFIEGKRILEINRKFIPQLRVRKGLKFEWHGVAATEYSTYTEYKLHDAWYEQIGKCAAPNINKAANNLYGWVESQRLKKLANKQIVHEVEPEAWVKLKDKA